MCQHCHMRTSCALDALKAGTSLDGCFESPASDVIMAGVHCKGDTATARALAEIAGEPVPTYRGTAPRPKADNQCVNCHEPMVPWTRGKVPMGYVMHYARNFCTNCRIAYLKAMKGQEKRSTNRTLVNGRPKNCRKCQRPMVPIGHRPGQGEVKHLRGGVCETCANAPRSKRLKLLPTPPVSEPPVSEPLAPPAPAIFPTSEPPTRQADTKEPTVKQRLDSLEQALRQHLEVLDTIEALEQQLRDRLEQIEQRLGTHIQPAGGAKRKPTSERTDEDQLERRRAAERERRRRRIEAETPEQRERRLAKERERYQQRKAAETPEHREERLAKRRARKRAKNEGD
ncbi:hypothetical protein CEPID_06035 [Corynebacterium epidermidicanis]|uniref:4Fe-4S Wbl-type domain-containing protein n=1 Tax=Corynebacterium epidermidicanis TaxID=1050174 RepID=A0A0G3GU25_9CORY|nr:hypothetical protein CEPID_06035 [Corynebacterium epidermidicanis]